MSFVFAAAPSRLIAPDGKPCFGVYAGPIPDLNVQDYAFRNLRRPPWTLVDKTARMLLKKWQFVGVLDEGFVFGSAVIDLQYVGATFSYLYDKQSGQMVGHTAQAPLAKGVQFSPSAIAGDSFYRAGGKSLELGNTLNDGWRTAKLDCGSQLKADVRYHENATGASIVTRLGVRGFGYTYKIVGLPAEGEVVANGKTYPLSKNAVALLDWSVATAQRETYWNWAAAAGTDTKGNRIALNLSCGINETGHTENVFWVNGQPEKPDVVSFDYDWNDLHAPWRIRSMDERVDLTFHPEGERLEDTNLLVVASILHQPFGRFEGTLKTDRETHQVSLYGFAEEHYAKW